MKPFNLEAAKRGEPIVCRDGTPAKLIAHVPEVMNEFHRVVVMHNLQLFPCSETGLFEERRKSSYDLFMAPKKRTVWVNFYPDGTAEWFASEFEALNCGRSLLTNGRAYPVEIEE